MSDQTEGYKAAADKMEKLAAKQPGYLGVESCRASDGFGLTISYWDSLEAIAEWKNHPEHRAVRAEGRRRWYSEYSVTVAKVERGVIPSPSTNVLRKVAIRN
ncbi:MAG: antibiotic biosynthesis monooxygenase [Pseudomonadota bacterium]